MFETDDMTRRVIRGFSTRFTSVCVGIVDLLGVLLRQCFHDVISLSYYVMYVKK